MKTYSGIMWIRARICHDVVVLHFSRMRSEGFLFLSGGLGAGSCLTRFRHVCAERSRRVRMGVAIGRCPSACLEHGSVRAALDRG